MRFVICFCSFVVLFPQANAATPSMEELAAIERAHAAVDEVRQNFKKSLQGALAGGDAKKALPKCTIEAPTLTKVPDQKGAENVVVGRTSHRLRNSANSPREWVKPFLDQFTKASVKDIPKHVIISLGKDRYGYLEPIFVEPVCLTCHGKKISKDVGEAIRKAYPSDKAVDFEVGDFRGLLWLEMGR